MQPISITPSTEKGSVSVTIGEKNLSLTTEEVDALIRRLLETRPALLPSPVLEPEPPQLRPISPGFRYWVHPYFLVGGGVLLHLPHPAMGWMTWHCPSDVVLQLVQTLQLWRVPPPPAVPVPIPR